MRGVACLQACRDWLSQRGTLAHSAKHQRRVAAAAAFLHDALYSAHLLFGRADLALRSLASATSHVDEHFGGELTHWINRSTLEMRKLYARAYAAAEQGQAVPSDVVPGLLELHDRGIARGDTHLRFSAIDLAVEVLSAWQPADWHVAVRSLRDASLAAWSAHADRQDPARTYHLQAIAAADMRAWADLEHLMEHFAHWQTSPVLRERYNWQYFVGYCAHKRADWSEAVAHFAEAAVLGGRIGDHRTADWARLQAKECQDNEERAHRRRRKPMAAVTAAK